MYEKNADLMGTFSNARGAVSRSAQGLLDKIRGSSANDGVAALPPDAQQAVNDGISKLPDSARQTVDSLRDKPIGGLAEKATKLLGEGGRKIGDKAEKALADVNAPSGLSYIPGIGGYLSGLFRPTPGRGRFVSSVGEGVSGNLGGVAGGAAGVVGGAGVGLGGALLAALLSKGKIRLGNNAVLGGGFAGGLTGNSLGTHAGAGLFRDIAAKPEKSAELTGNQEEIDVNNNDKIEAADLANLRKGKNLSKDKTKFAEWPDKPTFTANMSLPEKQPNRYVVGKKSAPKANTAGIEEAQAKLASQDNASPSRSAAGDSKGVKYKQQNEDHATGTAAFDSLDKYLRMSKKAGLNDFQTNFFGRLIQEGRNQQEIYAAVKQAGDQFGAEVGKELKRGLKKLGFAGLGGLIGKGLMTAGKATMGNAGNIAKIGVGGGALAAGAGAGYGAAKMPGAVQEGITQAAPAIGANAANTAMDRMQKMPSQFGDMAGQALQKMPAQFGDMAGQALQKMPAQFGDMANQAMQRMPFSMGGGQSGIGQSTGGFAGPYKQSRDKQAGVWDKLVGLGLKGTGVATKAAPRIIGTPTAGTGLANVVNQSTKSTLVPRMVTGATTGAINPFTGAMAEGPEDETGWGMAGRIGASALAGAGLGGAGNMKMNNMLKRMSGGTFAGGAADQAAGLAGYDTGGYGAKGGFLGAAALPKLYSKGGVTGIGATKIPGTQKTISDLAGFAGGTGGKSIQTADLLSLADPFNMGMKGIGAGYKALKPFAKSNPIATAGLGLGAAGLGTGAYMANQGVNAVNGMRDDMAKQMTSFRNEANNHLSGIRQDLGGGMGGIGKFFEENKHWLMPALLAGGGALAGGALGGGQGAALGGLSLPALYMMHQNGMFGGGAANPLQSQGGPAKRPDYAQQNQQYEQEQVNKQVAARTKDPRLAGPLKTPTPPMPKSAGDRAVKLMRHFAKN